MKSLAQIHQQTLDILARLRAGKHIHAQRFFNVTRIHNRYIHNACTRFGVDGMHRLSIHELNAPLRRSFYATAPAAVAYADGDNWD